MYRLLTLSSLSPTIFQNEADHPAMPSVAARTLNDLPHAFDCPAKVKENQDLEQCGENPHHAEEFEAASCLGAKCRCEMAEVVPSCDHPFQEGIGTVHEVRNGGE